MIFDHVINWKAVLRNKKDILKEHLLELFITLVIFDHVTNCTALISWLVYLNRSLVIIIYFSCDFGSCEQLHTSSSICRAYLSRSLVLRMIHLSHDHRSSGQWSDFPSKWAAYLNRTLLTIIRLTCDLRTCEYLQNLSWSEEYTLIEHYWEWYIGRVMFDYVVNVRILVRNGEFTWTKSAN
jgi:hypothetical protein